MKENSNPYTGILQEIRGSMAEEKSKIGKVLSASPLTIAYRGIDFDEDELLINPLILAEIAVGDKVYIDTYNSRLIVICILKEVSELE